MKKTISLLLAVSLAFQAFFAMGFFIVPPTKSTAQGSIIAVMPVNTSQALSGTRAYTDMMKTTKIYNTGDIVTVAVIFEMQNLAKHNAKSVANTRMDILVQSDTIDLSYFAIAPSVVYNIIAADQKSIAKIANNTIPIDAAAISYVKEANGVIVKLKGVPNGDVYFDKNLPPINGKVINEGSSQNTNFQNFAPFMGYVSQYSDDKCLYIPSINSSTYAIGTQTPDSVQYSLLISGVAKKADKGNMSARMRYFNS